jgi:ribosomal-protein-alanine acetyltransferase
VTALRQSLKKLVFGILGKDPDAVVVSFLCGNEARAKAMAEEMRRLIPDRRHFVVRLGLEPGEEQASHVITLFPGSVWRLHRQLRRSFRRWKIGQAAVLFDGDTSCRALKLAAFLLAPGKILAYNAGLERHHLRLRSAIASMLFLRGVPLDRIFLRPRWLCPWKRDRSSVPETYQILDGRELSPERPRVAVLSPYFPYPLSHGGAVRIFHLLREAARRYDVFLFAFTEAGHAAEPEPVLEFCAKAVLVPKPRYREPRWSSLAPPEVHEYRSPVMLNLLDEIRRKFAIRLLQVEYTQLAYYGGDVLVEHDVTFDLYQQVYEQRRSLSAWWDLARWRRYERRAVARYRRVVAMSEKDAGLLRASHVREIPNGVDLERFRPVAETEGQRALFIGSFRHFPNVIAYRFLTEQVWPLVKDELPLLTLTVVAGPDPLTYWRAVAGHDSPYTDDRIRLLEFVRDVRPLYEETNLVLAPTLVSAGTNVKVLEAMAMERAVLSTSSGCAGLGLQHGASVWIGDDARAFAAGLRRLFRDADLRKSLARTAREHAERNFDWRRSGLRQRALWSELLGAGLVVREAGGGDLEEIAAVQAASPEASVWDPASYLDYGCLVCLRDGRVAGFIAYREIGREECEILNLAVAPGSRRRGIATALAGEVMALARGAIFLEVRSSNVAARNLYEKLGFRQAGLRQAYYHSPPEDGIVMRFQSC